MPRMGAGARIFLTGVTGLALVCAPAQACVEPAGDRPAVSAKAGSEVPFEVPNTLKGAGYTLTLEGDEVASGTDPGGEKGVSGTFTMPSLRGGARRVSVRIAVTHSDDGSDWSTSMPVDYEPKEIARPRDEPRPSPAPSAAAPPPSSGPPPVSPQPAAAPLVPPIAPIAPAAGDVRGVLRRSPAMRRVTDLLRRLAPSAGRIGRRRGARRARGRGWARRTRTADLGSIGLKDPVGARPDTTLSNPSLSERVPDFGMPVAWRLLLAAAVVGFLLALTFRAFALGRARRRLAGT